MRSELHQHSMCPRTERGARKASVAIAALLALAWVAWACSDESVVDPPVATIASDDAPTAMAMAQATDRDILVALYNATDGPNWRDNTNWLTDEPLGEWYGVDTDGSGRVVRLDLSGRWDDEGFTSVSHGLVGAIPPELGGLVKLEALDLRHNELSGSIPPELGGLVKLKTLDLGRNDLSAIPSELGDLASLVTLNLQFNELTGAIPSELGGLAQLFTLSLGANELTGTIPSELGRLVNLANLGVGNNGLTGPIPAELGGLANLGSLWLAGNQLSGPIPAELGNLTRVWQISLAGNQLSGIIPLSFRQLRLDLFWFQDNAGLCLPDGMVAWYEAIGERDGPVCPDREVLNALYEAAGGEGWTNSTGWLGNRALDDWYGVEVDSSGLVSAVDLAGNGLSGGLTERLGDLAGLTALRVGNNALTGRLPSSLRRTPLRELRYANTDLCAPTDQSFREWLAGLARHEGTGLQCPPPSDREILTTLYERTDGANWEASRNWLTDAPLGAWYGVDTDAAGGVTSLELSRNGLEGTIPPELGGLAELETLRLWGNNLPAQSHRSWERSPNWRCWLCTETD